MRPEIGFKKVISQKETVIIWLIYFWYFFSGITTTTPKLILGNYSYLSSCLRKTKKVLNFDSYDIVCPKKIFLFNNVPKVSAWKSRFFIVSEETILEHIFRDSDQNVCLVNL